MLLRAASACGGGTEGCARVRASAQDVRQADLRTPGDPAEARRNGDTARGGAPAGRERGARIRRGERCDMEAGMAKYFASEAALENSIDAVRIHGGYGYSTEFDVERYYRDAPLMCIGEGTNEMQRVMISRQLMNEESRGMLPLAGVRMVTIEQLRCSTVRLDAARGSGSGGHQDRECRDQAATPRASPDRLCSARTTVNISRRSTSTRRASPQSAFGRGQGGASTACCHLRSLVNKLRGDQPAKMGLNYKRLAKVNPKTGLRACVSVWPRQRPHRLAGL